MSISQPALRGRLEKVTKNGMSDWLFRQILIFAVFCIDRKEKIMVSFNRKMLDCYR